MAAEFLIVLGVGNAAIALAALMVLSLRRIVVRLCGADVAYNLWLLPPVMGLGAMLAALSARPAAYLAARTAVEGVWAPALALWLTGVAAGAAFLVLAYRRIQRLVRKGELGPAIVGLIRPRVQLPNDFEATYSAPEREVIRAHERAHLLRHDSLVNHALAAAQCLFWFNPLVHVACHFARRDQEMACDLSVMDERPETRALYARTLLKAQLKGGGLLLGCTWSRHPLEERVAALVAPPPVYSRIIGIVALTAVGAQLVVMFAGSLGAG